MSIVLENVNYTYSQTGKGLKDITAYIPKGEWTALIGKSGSGKTTLLKVLARLFRPDSGKIIYNPENARVGLILQFPEHNFFASTVFEEITFGLKRSGLDKTALTNRVNEALESVGLDSGVLSKSPFQLSSSVQRLVAVCSCLVLKPHFLLLDEPGAGLDPKKREELLTSLDQWRKKTGCGIIISTHELDDITRWAKRLLVLKEGRLVYMGDMEENSDPFTQSQLWDLGEPTMTRFLKALLNKGIKVPSFLRDPESFTFPEIEVKNSGPE
jgi:energy-coupling factor transport system ATP-binding protein